MKKKRRIWLWVLLALIVAGVCVAVFGGKKGPRYSIEASPAQQDSIVQTVTATGVVQPVYKVVVGTQVSGIVKKLYVDYNSEVKKGQLLAELDKSVLQEEVNVAKANLSMASSQCALTQKNFDRVKTLFDQKAATQQEYDQLEAQLEQDKNQLVTAKAQYTRAATNLRYAEIYSPIDGIVISRQVEEGQTVQGAYSVPDLFTIAKDMKEVQVEAKVDEADIGQVRTGQAVTFKVDAFPGEEFRGSVTQIRKEPQSNNNVVTYVVIIHADNPDEKLFPGMTATVSIVVEQEEGLVVPYYATQLKPTVEQVAALVAEGYAVDTLSGRHDATLWVKDGKRLRQVEVTLGAHTKVQAVVSSGIQASDTVVSAIIDYRQARAERKENMFD